MRPLQPPSPRSATMSKLLERLCHVAARRTRSVGASANRTQLRHCFRQRPTIRHSNGLLGNTSDDRRRRFASKSKTNDHGSLCLRRRTQTWQTLEAAIIQGTLRRAKTIDGGNAQMAVTHRRPAPAPGRISTWAMTLLGFAELGCGMSVLTRGRLDDRLIGNRLSTLEGPPPRGLTLPIRARATGET